MVLGDEESAPVENDKPTTSRYGLRSASKSSQKGSENSDQIIDKEEYIKMLVAKNEYLEFENIELRLKVVKLEERLGRDKEHYKRHSEKFKVIT